MPEVIVRRRATDIPEVGGPDPTHAPRDVAAGEHPVRRRR
jgi:hypothetical protein